MVARCSTVALLLASPVFAEAKSPFERAFGLPVNWPYGAARSPATDAPADAEAEAERRRLGESHLSSLDPWMGRLHCDSVFNCECITDSCLFGKEGLVLPLLDFILSLFIMLYMFKGLGEICDNYFMTALEEISAALKLSNDVAGATFMAAGSSAPELFTSVVSTFFMVSEAGVGTIIGSAIFNIFVIVGATGFVACKGGKVLDIWWYPLTRDTTFYLISIAELAVVLLDEEIHLAESVVMLCTYVCYILYMKINPWVVAKLGGEPGKKDEVGDAPVDAKDDGAAENGEGNVKDGPPTDVPKLKLVLDAETPVTLPPDALPGAPEDGDGTERKSDHLENERVHWDHSNSPRHGRSPRSASKEHHAHADKAPSFEPAKESAPPAAPAASAEDPEKGEEKEGEEEDGPTPCCDRFDPISRFWALTMPTADGIFGKTFFWWLFFYCVLMIMGLSYFMVDSCIRMGEILNIDKLTMGLLVLAAGTSIPDTLASISVAKQGEGDMAVANALGSNVFDILLGLGIPWTLKIAAFDTPADVSWVHGSSGLTVYATSPVYFQGASAELLNWIIVLTIVVVLFFLTLIFFRWKLNQKVGTVMLCMYLVYVAYALINFYVIKQ